ncbi:hypothetical protein BDV97DRAFT_343863, partial [Delphinella strobiligena]
MNIIRHANMTRNARYKHKEEGRRLRLKHMTIKSNKINREEINQNQQRGVNRKTRTAKSRVEKSRIEMKTKTNQLTRVILCYAELNQTKL